MTYSVRVKDVMQRSEIHLQDLNQSQFQRSVWNLFPVNIHNYRYFSCLSQKDYSNVIDSCDLTSDLDLSIVKYCEDLPDNVPLVYLNKRIYKNIFCFMCRTGHCLDLKCPLGHVIQKSTCTPGTDVPAKGGFSLRLWFQLNVVYGDLTPKSTMMNVLDALTLQMLASLQEYSQNIFLLVGAKYNDTLTTQKFKPPYKSHIFRVESRFQAKPKVILTDVHVNLIGKLINQNISVVTEQYELFIFRSFNVLNSIAFDQSVFDLIINESCDRTLNPMFHRVDRNLTEFTNTYLVKYQQFYYLDHALQLFTQKSDCNKTKELEKGDDFEFWEKFTNISEVLLCLYVSFDQSAYEVTVNETVLPPDITIAISLGSLKISITDKEDFKWLEIDENSTLNVCRELLDRKIKEFLDRVQDTFDLSLPEYVVTIVCFAASMACLILTLLTYFLFPVLRNDAGINNMFLSGSLLLAQVSVLVSSHIDRMNAACTAVGIATHWLWLWMFSWSFICSHRMFQVFTATSNTRHESTNVTGRVRRRTVVSLLPPTMVTLCVVLVSYVTSEGSNIGYGTSSCYLDSGDLIVICVVAPLILITCSNLTFFLITVYKIYQTRHLQSSSTSVINENNKYLFIYAKLSTLTGAFWTVAVVAEALDNDVLQYISIVLNGLQGVTIFISFTCNKRVIALYSSLIHFRQNKNTQITDNTLN
ncbi:hypothetical protein Btru_055271 [Bulinus truncatus]|nr:hypothetical protein Btru_055271 [Bulinus truncatus]